MARLDEICVINMGQSPDSLTYNEEGNGLPFFREMQILERFIRWFVCGVLSQPK